MDEKIRNLELDLIKKEENTITGYDNYSKIRELGTEEITYYDSNLGRIEVYKFSDKKGNSEEFIATNRTDINKRRKDFYGQKVVPAKIFSQEKTNRLMKIADDVQNKY